MGGTLAAVNSLCNWEPFFVTALRHGMDGRIGAARFYRPIRHDASVPAKLPPPKG